MTSPSGKLAVKLIDPDRGLCVYQSRNCYHQLGKWFVAYGDPSRTSHYEDFVETAFNTREQAEAIMHKLLLGHSLAASALLIENSLLRAALQKIADEDASSQAGLIASDALQKEGCSHSNTVGT